MEKQPKIIPLLTKFIAGIVLWATYFLPIFSFEKAFKIFKVTPENSYGVYADSIAFFSLLAILLTLLFLWLAPKLFRKPFYCVIIVIVYLIFYYFTCTSIAWDYRIVFGTTWESSEIFSELVKPLWYFYVFGILGAFFNYKWQQLISERLNKKQTRN